MHHKIIGATCLISIGVLLAYSLLPTCGLWRLSSIFSEVLGTLGFHPGSTSLWRYPWSLFTYMWIHIDPIHLMVNMLVLGCLGTYFLRVFQGLQLLSTYIGGGIAGALLYGLAGFIPWMPVNQHIWGVLYGASASICAVGFALGMAQPKMAVALPFIKKRVNFLALLISLYICIAILTSDNLGGLMAHAGGAIYGIVWGQTAGRGWRDYPTRMLERLRLLARKHRHHIEPSDPEQAIRDKKRQEVLGKIRQSGYRSLSLEEQASLVNTSEENANE